MPVAAALQHASCYSPATCQLQLVLNTCSRCMDCKKAVVWYNSVLGPLPSLLALICSCRCAFCKDVINLTAHKNSTRHFNINAGMPLHTTYPHDLNSEFFVSVHYHTACSYPDCKQEDIINCEAAILHHKRYMKWHQLKQAVIILSDDDDVVDSPSRKVPPHPPMFSKLCNLPVATSATCLLQALPTDLTNETRKVVVPPLEIRPDVTILFALWPDHGPETTRDGGTLPQLLPATHALLQVPSLPHMSSRGTRCLGTAISLQGGWIPKCCRLCGTIRNGIR